MYVARKISKISRNFHFPHLHKYIYHTQYGKLYASMCINWRCCEYTSGVEKNRYIIGVRHAHFPDTIFSLVLVPMVENCNNKKKKKITELPYIPQKSCERFLCSKVDKEGQGKLRVYKFVLVIRKAYVFGREKQKCPKFSLKSSRFSRTWDWFEKYSRRSWDVYHQDNLSWREVGFNSGKIFFAMETA